MNISCERYTNYGKNGAFYSCFVGLCNCIRLGVLIIGSFAGVGFLTGAEIVEFFMRYRNFYSLEMCLFFILFFALLLKSFDVKLNLKTNAKLQNFNQFCPKNTFLLKFKIKTMMTNLSALLVSGAMISGLRNLIFLLFNNNQIFIFCLCIIIVFFILIEGSRWLGKVNFLMVFMLLFVLVVLVDNFNYENCLVKIHDVASSEKVNIKPLLVSMGLVVSYVFMNMTQVKSVCSVSSIRISNKQKFILALVIAGVLSGIISVIMLFLHNNILLAKSSMPLFEFFEKLNNSALLTMFVLGLFVGLGTTLLSCLLSLRHGFLTFFESRTMQSMLVLMLAIIVGILDFSVFVSIIYPVVGVINMIIFLFL